MRLRVVKLSIFAFALQKTQIRSIVFAKKLTGSSVRLMVAYLLKLSGAK